jgi:hypothetical protein
MRKLAVWAAGMLVAMSASIANAGFTFTKETTAGPAGFDIVRYYAKLTPTPDAVGDYTGATGMQSIDATLSSSGNFKFNFFDQSADGIPDWDPTGAFTANDANGKNNNTATAGTFLRPGFPDSSGTGAIFVATYDPPFIKSTDNDFNGQADPGTDQTPYTVLKAFRIAGVIQGGVDSSALTGKGALIAKAVVPTGSTVDIAGLVAADAGPLTPIIVPEPATLSLVGIAGVALFGRRRRVA